MPEGYQNNYTLTVHLLNGTDVRVFVNATNGCSMWRAIYRV
jgi:hypothetical protein